VFDLHHSFAPNSLQILVKKKLQFADFQKDYHRIRMKKLAWLKLCSCNRHWKGKENIKERL
jgi:hypothetical protein